MHPLRVLRTLGPIDALSIRRDSLLRWVLVLPLGIALLVRLVLPTFLARVNDTLNLDVLPYFAPLIGFALLMFAPTLAGMVVGFLLLDQRDDRSLFALLVSPLPTSAYLAYRLLAPVVVSILLTLVMFPLAGIDEIGPGGTLACALAAAPLAPMMALALGAFAENKVQGFALVKGLGVVLPAPLIAYFVDAPWTALLAVVPTYWPARLCWALLSDASQPWLFLLGGLVYQGALVALLLRRFDATVHRGNA